MAGMGMDGTGTTGATTVLARDFKVSIVISFLIATSLDSDLVFLDLDSATVSAWVTTVGHIGSDLDFTVLHMVWDTALAMADTAMADTDTADTDTADTMAVTGIILMARSIITGMEDW